MILDTSAVIAILLEEPRGEALKRRMLATPRIAVGAPTLLETAIVLANRERDDPVKVLGDFLREFSYAAARHARMPLLFVGNDFSETDVNIDPTPLTPVSE